MNVPPCTQAVVMPVAERKRAGVMAVAAENDVNTNADGDTFIVLRGRRIAKKKKRKCVKCKCTQIALRIWLGHFSTGLERNSGLIYAVSINARVSQKGILRPLNIGCD